MLGCMLLSPHTANGEVFMQLNGEIDAMYDVRHRTILGEIFSAHREGRMLDGVTLFQTLSDKGLITSAGGVQYVADLPDSAPTAANLGYYLEIVVEKFLLRRLIQICTDSIISAHSSDGVDVNQLIGEFESKALGVRTSQTKNRPTAKALVLEAQAELERRFEAQGKILGISTGMTDLDQLLDGLHPGELILLAGWPSTGKTSLAMNMVEHVVLEQALPVAVFSQEMSAHQLMLRMQCSQAKVNLRDANKGQITQQDFERLTSAGARLANSPIHIISEPGITADILRSEARRMKQTHGIRFVVVDYMQLIGVRSKQRDMNRAEALGLVSNECKEMAMELDIPVLLLSQLTDEGKLYGSREPGHDADVLIRLVNDGEWLPDNQPVLAQIEKQRNGPTGQVRLLFRKSITRFENMAQIHGDDVPNRKQPYQD
jgi:replicative DNA helicase